MTSRLRHHFVVRAVYCYCRHAYINVLTIAALLLFLPLIQTFLLSAATITTTRKLLSRTPPSSIFHNSDCHDRQDSFKKKALAALVPLRHLDSA